MLRRRSGRGTAIFSIICDRRPKKVFTSARPRTDDTFGSIPTSQIAAPRHYDGRVTLRLGTLGACVAGIGAMACGVSVGQPISLGAGRTVDAASDVVTVPDAADAADANRDPLTDGLVAYWKLDEKRATDVVIDSSQRGHSGIAVNAPGPSGSLPPISFPNPSSRTFDGVNQYVVIGNTEEMNFEGEITMAAWVNIAATSDGCQDIVAHGFCFEPEAEVALRLGSATCGLGGAAHSLEAGSWQGANHLVQAPLDELDLNTWIHVAGVYDGQSWRLYRNGKEVASQESTIGAIHVESDWAIGAKPPSVPPTADRFFNGSIDDVRIYRRALGPSELLELYHL
jgi:hypothetical protein